MKGSGSGPWTRGLDRSARVLAVALVLAGLLNGMPFWLRRVGLIDRTAYARELATYCRAPIQSWWLPRSCSPYHRLPGQGFKAIDSSRLYQLSPLETPFKGFKYAVMAGLLLGSWVLALRRWPTLLPWRRLLPVLPLLVSCVFAYFVARATGTTSMYEITQHHYQDAQERLRLRTTQMRALIQPAQTVVPLTASVADMTRVFLEYPVKYLYVTDEAGRFRGAVALKDITSDLLDKRDTTDKTAAHYAHTPFPLLTPDMPLSTALERFMAFQGERLPVIESEAEPTLAGVVYKTSLLDAYRRMTGER